MNPNWAEKKLHEVCILQRGFDLPKRLRVHGSYPLVSSSGISDVHKEFKVKAPGVVTGRSGSIGNVFFVEHDFWPLNTTLYIKEFHGNDARFIYYLLRYIGLDKYASGAGVPTLNRNFVHDEKVKVPTSITEQKQIVAVLDKAFAAIDQARANIEKNLQNAKELFQSKLNEIFTQKGEGWEEKKLGDSVKSISTGPFGSLLHKSDYTTHGVPLVNPINMVNKRIVPDEKKQVAEDILVRLKSYILKTNDVVVARRGDIGRCALVEEEQNGWLCGTGSFFISPSDELRPDFLVELISSSTYTKKLLDVATGATMKNISNKSLSALSICFPPIEKQVRLMKEIGLMGNQTSQIEKAYKVKLAALDDLKKSILQNAFAGELI